MTDLSSENKSLRGQLDDLISIARVNEKKQELLRNKALRFIKLDNLPGLIKEATTRYEKDLSLTRVTLGIVSNNNDLERFLELEGTALKNFNNLIPVNDFSLYDSIFGKGHKPYLGSYNPSKHAWLYPNSKDDIKSIAILPLMRRGRIIGSLNCSSIDPERFKSSHASNFLDHLAAILSVCLENSLFFSRVTESSLKDPLTNLWNRRFFDNNAEKHLNTCKENKSFSILTIDIDKFKVVNDTYGHDIGDSVIKGIASITRALLHDKGVLCRFGGEEFVGIIPCIDAKEVISIAENIRGSIESHEFTSNDGMKFYTTVSIGISTLSNSESSKKDNTIKDMLKKSDDCLYEAKKTGRNKVVNIVN